MFGRVVFWKPRNREDWKRVLTSLSGKDLCGIFLLVGEMTPWDFQEIRPLFKELGVPVFGGVFPGIIYGGSWYTEGVLGCAVERPVSVKVIRDLGSFAGLPEDRELTRTAETFLVIVDGLTGGISSFLDVLFETCNRQVSFIGGGAGSLGPERRPVLFAGEDCFAGGALLVGVEGPMGVGVSHGWEPMYGPLVANRTRGNVIVELNWQPAFLKYRKILKEKAGKTIRPKNFFEIAKCHPFGMVKIDESIVVRDPLRLEGHDIVLVGEVPQNSVVMILRGEPARLINAAREAAGRALACFREQTGGPGRSALVIDCISRVLYLGSGMARELAAICSSFPPDLQVFGFLSIGEIANSGDRYLEFYNKTTVVGVG